MTARSTAELITLLDSDNRHARAVAAIELAQHNIIGALPKLRTLVDDEDNIVALSGMYACWMLGEDRVSIERMIHALDSEDEESVQLAVQIVTEMGDFLVPKLETKLNDSPKVTIQVLNMLDEISSPSALAVVKSVKTDDPQVIQLIEEILEDWD